MDTCILLGVDEDFSLQTQNALQTASDLFAQAGTGLHIILLTVIPLPYDPSPALMKSLGRGQLHPQAPTPAQRADAQKVLAMAGDLLRRHSCGLAPQHIEPVLRFGNPADEVVRLARERWPDCVVLGSRGNSAIHNLRRLIAGSISGDIVRLAPCPVITVTLPRLPRPGNLVPWRAGARGGRVKG